MTNRTTRIKNEYSRPDSREINGQSTKGNIAKMAARASELSDGYKHRAASGAVELPDTFGRNGRDNSPDGTRSGDMHALAKKNDLNHSKRDSDYMPSVKRQA
jgi:hypothetical protein